MIYLCIPSHDEAATVGLLLWRIRQAFAGCPREYHSLVADDASTDATPDVLASYARALPLTVTRHPVRLGTARTTEALLREAAQRTDRAKRDFAIVLHADFRHDVRMLPEVIRLLEGGADVVVAEGTLPTDAPRGERLVRRWGPSLLRGSIGVPEVGDLLSGFVAVRLVCLRNALKAAGDRLLTCEGHAAHAELIGRLARHSRRIETLAAVERLDLRRRASRFDAWAQVRGIWQARGALRLPPRPAPRPRESAA